MRKHWLGVALIAAGTFGVLSCSHGSPTDLGPECVLCSSGPALSGAMSFDPANGSLGIITVRPGASVTFYNKDSVPHQVGTDSTRPCPELAGPVQTPGQTFTAVMANKIEDCAVVDRLHPGDERFHGLISVRTR